MLYPLSVLRKHSSQLQCSKFTTKMMCTQLTAQLKSKKNKRIPQRWEDIRCRNAIALRAGALTYIILRSSTDLESKSTRLLVVDIAGGRILVKKTLNYVPRS
ncbi:unnamed protein product [Amoebophrya sp. A120]|nr:unnamed protein product [Amoebophrya sp. A120]|eukprot:GSA120T00010418001.1